METVVERRQEMNGANKAGQDTPAPPSPLPADVPAAARREWPGSAAKQGLPLGREPNGFSSAKRG